MKNALLSKFGAPSDDSPDPSKDRVEAGTGNPRPGLSLFGINRTGKGGNGESTEPSSPLKGDGRMGLMALLAASREKAAQQNNGNNSQTVK
jgi:hypothetical protein